MTLNEYKIWLDGAIAATGDERLKVAREMIGKVQEAAPYVPPLSPPPFVSPMMPGLRGWEVTCGSVTGVTDPNIRAWNGAVQ
jgi:hypothetical protein